MSLKGILLTTAASLTLTGAAFAQDQTPAQSTTGDADAEIAQATGYAPGWNEDLDQRYGEIADRQVTELLGINVLSENGEDVGEVDNFVLMEDQLKAVVGVGGFLGLGEHEVAISLSDMTYDGENLIVAFTEEQLRAMPEYTEELEQVALNENDTFRTRAPMDAPAADTAAADVEADSDSKAMDMADGTIEGDADEATAPSGEDVAAAEDAAGGEHTATEEVAEAQKGEIEQEAEEVVAEADSAMESAGEAVEDGAAATTEVAQNATEETGEWFKKIDAEFADIAEMKIADIEGATVATANGETVGEIDNLATHGGDLVAVVGIGGFLGMGEHDVALDVSKLTWDGEKFIVEGYTEDELKALPEVDTAALNLLDDDATLRDQSNM